MKGRKAAIGAVLALAAVGSALIVSSVGSAKPTQDDFRWRSSRTSGPCKTARSTSSRTRAGSRSARSSGSQTRVYQTKKDAEPHPERLAAGRAGYDLVFGVGFLNYTAVERGRAGVPEPRTGRASISPTCCYSRKPKNVGGHPVRRARGRLPRRLPRGAAAEEPGRPEDHQRGRREQGAGDREVHRGYSQGAKKANPRSRCCANYANDPTFSDQAKCKETALGQIAQGSRVVFQVAGGCGLGALDARRRRRRSGASASTPTRSTSAGTCSRARSSASTSAVEDITSLASQGNFKPAGRLPVQPEEQRRRSRLREPAGCRRRFVARTNAIGKQIGAGKIKVRPIIKFKASN